MKKALLFPFLFLFLVPVNAQHDTGNKPRIDSGVQTVPVIDDTSLYKIDYKVDQEQMARNTENLMRSISERRQKEKRNAMIRIGIGLLFFVVLIIGWRRRAVKK
jgi:hypothetical protein